jgi:membrane associated rhomboid family serine protease
MRPPPIGQFQRYPITTFIAVLAIVATLRSSFGEHINPIFLSGGGDCLYEPWRLLTTALFHGDPLHLIFNLYWLWVFGTLVEERFGHGTTLGIFVLFAAGSDAAELAVFHSSIGLSGVGYGLFGMLWTLSKLDPRFRDAVDRQTIQLMVGWFFLCIVLTAMNVWRVGNVAHGAGYVLGALLGWTISTRIVGQRLLRGAVLVAAALLCIAAGTIVQHKSFSEELGHDFAYRGYQALEKGDNQQAATLYEKAVAIDPHQFGWWNNLGIAYYRLGRIAESQDAWHRATALKPERDASE